MPSPHHLYIGIDLGTSGCRAIAINKQYNIVGEASATLPAPQRIGTHVEQDPALWWAAVCDCLNQLTAMINPQHVVAIAVDGTSATLLLTDGNGTPLGPALMYNDARATPQAATITRIAPVNTAAQGASSALAKLLWLTENGMTAKAQHACHQADWIAATLSGYFPTKAVISDYNNALKLGFDAQQKIWPDWLNALKLPVGLLPSVVAPGTVIGTLSKTIARQFTLPESTRIVAGTTDSTASFLATGASNIGEAVTALGSTLVVKVISEHPVFAPEYGVYSQPLISNGQLRWLVGGASNSGGSVLKHYFTAEQLTEMTPQLQPDIPTGLDYYPLPARGERFPVNDPQFAARLEPRPIDDVVFFQGMLEGIAHIEAKAYRLLTELGAPYPLSVRTTGGGAQNAAWTTLRKNLLNTEILSAQHTEAAFGVALLAAIKTNEKKIPL
ncbi:MAG: FGGY-family carbohydrate kinase [Gammaproteobacteria bacterium]|nr:FGGY-family carbohydrate kinase [Gammaproteobacteria bacterium]MCF6260492.1 FGGY-family carbohydrate kinase [Gammaproteobacteria bacterium]